MAARGISGGGVVTSQGAPNDVDAERAVLSAVILDPTRLDEVRDVLPRPEMLWLPAHRHVWGAILELSDQRQPIDVQMVASHLRARGDLEVAGGTSGLAQLVDATPAVRNVLAHARIVRQCSRLRGVLTECQRVTADIHAGEYGDDISGWADRTEAALAGALRDDDAAEDRTSTLEELAKGHQVRLTLAAETRERGEEYRVGRRTGMRFLDAHIHGFQPGHQIVIGGRPGQGKTALAMQLVVASSAIERVGWVVLSLEMTRDELIDRAIASVGRVNGNHLRAAELTPSEWRGHTRALAAMSRTYVVIDDSPILTPGTLRGRVRRAARKLPPGIPLGGVVVDHLQLTRPDHRHTGGRRDLEVGEMTASLKALAKEMGITVLALSQLSRPEKGKTPPPPQLTDLRESGNIEQDADIVMFVHRPSQYHRDDRPGEADIIIRKGRGCGENQWTVTYDGPTTRFSTDPIASGSEPMPTYDDVADMGDAW